MPDVRNLTSLLQSSQKTLFILCGLPYAGKSYVAEEVRKHADVVFVSVDELFHAKGFDWDANKLPDADTWQRIFAESYDVVRAALNEGKHVLYDSTNHTVVSRDALRDVAHTVGATARVVYVRTPVETVWARWEENRQRPTRSVVSRELVEQTIETFETPTADEQVITIDNLT